VSLPWFKVATDFADHPKVQHLASLLEIGDATAIGVIVRMWCWTAKFCPAGDFSAPQLLTSMSIKTAHDLHKQFDADPVELIEATKVLAALIESKWIDIKGKHHKAHEWAEFNAGYFVEEERRRERDRKRKRALAEELKNSNGIDKDFHRNSTGNDAEIRASEGEGEGEGDLKEEYVDRAHAPPRAELLQELWNETAAPALPRWMDMKPDSPRRRAADRALKRQPELDVWKAAVMLINRSHFCLGRLGRGWKASADWLLKPGVLEKIHEGQYENGKAVGL